MIAVSILEPDDTLLGTDWVRPLTFSPLSRGSDTILVNAHSTYSGAPTNHVRWVEAKDVFGTVWLGRRFGDVVSACGNYEAIRGPMPTPHTWADWRKTRPN